VKTASGILPSYRRFFLPTQLNYNVPDFSLPNPPQVIIKEVYKDSAYNGTSTFPSNVPKFSEHISFGKIIRVRQFVLQVTEGAVGDWY
jgi:hypothetical protein